jgi:RNA polymerase sigma-70 factor (ECF subfamily)
VSQTTYLLGAAREGDMSAIEALFSRHRGRLLAFLQLAMSPMLARRVSHEDILQETLLEASRKLGAFEPRGPSSFYAWLVAIARFKIAEAERAMQAHKRAREEPLVADPAQSGTSPSMGAMRVERAEHLRAALARLPDAQAEALSLRYLEGLSLAEAAQRMQRSESALKALVTRAFAVLAERLDEHS